MTKIDPILNREAEQWRYVSLLCGRDCPQVQLRFNERQVAISFLTALSKVCSSSTFLGTENRPFLAQMMLRAKLDQMAKLKGTDLVGLFSKALFLTI